MKVSKLHNDLVIPSANDLLVAASIAEQMSWKINDVSDTLRRRYYASDCKKEEADGKRAEKIAMRVRRALLELRRAAQDLGA
jgi:hypothetical protein